MQEAWLLLKPLEPVPHARSIPPGASRAIGTVTQSISPASEQRGANRKRGRPTSSTLSIQDGPGQARQAASAFPPSPPTTLEAVGSIQGLGGGDATRDSAQACVGAVAWVAMGRTPWPGLVTAAAEVRTEGLCTSIIFEFTWNVVASVLNN